MRSECDKNNLNWKVLIGTVVEKHKKPWYHLVRCPVQSQLGDREWIRRTLSHTPWHVNDFKLVLTVTTNKRKDHAQALRTAMIVVLLLDRHVNNKQKHVRNCVTVINELVWWYVKEMWKMDKHGKLRIVPASEEPIIPVNILYTYPVPKMFPHASAATIYEIYHKGSNKCYIGLWSINKRIGKDDNRIVAPVHDYPTDRTMEKNGRFEGQGRADRSTTGVYLR